MKMKFICIFTVLITGCAMPSYYQIYKVEAKEASVDPEKIIFEDSNCIITYDLWSSGGNIGFEIYNKTNADLILNLDKSFLVKNDKAECYFQNRTFTTMQSSSAIVSSQRSNRGSANQASSAAGVAFQERPEIIVPSKTYIVVKEFELSKTKYIDCDLMKYPRRNDPSVLKFEEENSPLRFKNLITYSLGAASFRFENEFYVSSISNYEGSSVMERVDTTSCGQRLQMPKYVLKDTPANGYYLKYSKVE